MLKLYWWDEEANFGDELSYYIVSKLSNRPTRLACPQIRIGHNIHCYLHRLKHKPSEWKRFPSFKGYVFPWQKAMFAVGSILDYATYKTIVWGSGFREFDSACQSGHIFAVRGKLSQNRLPKSLLKKPVALGDPALLLPLLFRPSVFKKYYISIIPHFTEHKSLSDKYGKDYHVIDIRTRNIENVVCQIVQSEYVLSTSLHGVIVAQAYGIPALWIKKGYINSSDFKFLDYFSAVDIEQTQAISYQVLDDKAGIPSLFKEHKDWSLIDKELLKKRQDDLLAAFRTCIESL